jgi:hypothetical protein
LKCNFDRERGRERETNVSYVHNNFV